MRRLEDGHGASAAESAGRQAQTTDEAGGEVGDQVAKEVFA